MSLILDALNRADKERSEQELSPSLHPAPAGPATNTSLWRWLSIALASATAAAISVYLLLSADQSGSGVPAEAPVDTSLANNDIAPMPTEKALPAPTATLAPAAKNTEPTDSAGLKVQPARAPVVTEDQNSIARLYQRPPPEQRTTAEKPLVETPATTDNSPVRSHRRKTSQDILQEIPFLSSLPPRFQQSVPNIEYSVHVYNEEDGSGMVTLNGSMRRIGSELAPGLRVIAILPDSVVLDYRGTQFRLYALNSWMNF